MAKSEYLALADAIATDIASGTPTVIAAALSGAVACQIFANWVVPATVPTIREPRITRIRKGCLSKVDAVPGMSAYPST